MTLLRRWVSKLGTYEPGVQRGNSPSTLSSPSCFMRVGSPPAHDANPHQVFQAPRNLTRLCCGTSRLIDYGIAQHPDAGDLYLHDVTRHKGPDSCRSPRGDEVALFQRHNVGDV